MMMDNTPEWVDLADEAEPLILFLRELYENNGNITFPVHIEANMIDWLRDYKKTVKARRVEEDAVAVG